MQACCLGFMLKILCKILEKVGVCACFNHCCFLAGKTLLRLNDGNLKRMGIKDMSHRSLILNEILKLEMKNFMQCFKGLQSGELC